MVKRWFLKLFIFLLPVVIIMGVMVAYGMYIGEAMPLEWVIQRQNDDENLIVFRPTSLEDLYWYKNLTVQKLQPEIVVLGSSTANNFHSFYFNDPSLFYNAAIPAMNIIEMSTFLSDLEDDELPEVLIVGLDLFLFNGVYTNANINRFEGMRPYNPIRYSFAGLQTLTQQILLGETSIAKLNERKNLPDNFQRLGLVALNRNNGYQNDGGRVLPEVFVSANDWNRWENERQKAHYELAFFRDIYVQGLQINQASIEGLESILRLAQEHNIIVIGLSLPNVVYDQWLNSPYHLYVPHTLNRFENLFSQYEMYYFNYSDPTWVDGSVEEMRDDIHAEQLLTLRIYADLVRKLPDILEKYSDLEYLENLIQNAPHPFYVINVLEIEPRDVHTELEIPQPTAGAYLQQARVFEHFGNHEKASESYQLAHQLNPRLEIPVGYLDPPEEQETDE